MSSNELFELLAPEFGEGVKDVTIVCWLKNVGDKINKDEPVLEIMTDKANMDVECPISGTLIEQRVEKDCVAPVGCVVAIIKPAT